MGWASTCKAAQNQQLLLVLGDMCSRSSSKKVLNRNFQRNLQVVTNNVSALKLVKCGKLECSGHDDVQALSEVTRAGQGVLLQVVKWSKQNQTC